MGDCKTGGCSEFPFLAKAKKEGAIRLLQTVILATFPHGGSTLSLFNNHRTGIPPASFSFGNGAKPSVKMIILAGNLSAYVLGHIQI